MSATPEESTLFSPCPRGLESCLADELAALGAQAIVATGGGVAYRGSLELAYRVNLHSRIASRVLRRIAQAPYRNEDDLYQLAMDVQWEAHFGASETIRVDISATRSPVQSLNFATLRLKDAIVDRLRNLSGERPSVDTRRPDVRIFGFLDEREASLYLDLSGEPLFKRGWRQRDDKGEAPLKENLAAGLLALAGWQPGRPLLDPFCGSGTIAIEAAQIAAGIAPGISRSFGFERLADFDPTLWQSLKSQALAEMQRKRGNVHEITASDIDSHSMSQARTNAQRAGLGEDAIRFETIDCMQIKPHTGEAGTLVCNPPYGERIDVVGGDYEQTMLEFGKRLKDEFGGWAIWILSSDRRLPGQLRMRERRKTPLFNGAIECRLFGFQMFEKKI